MLTPEEESRLEGLVAVISSSKNASTYPLMSAYDIEWLANKLLEVNNEAAKYSEELYKSNKELADFRQYYEG